MSQHDPDFNPAEHAYLGNAMIKRAGVVHEFTEWETNEYLRCLSSCSYFAKTYLKVIHIDRGLVPMDPYPYQEKMFEHFEKNRFSIVLAARQAGKSVGVIGFLAHVCCFRPDQTVAILANKGATAREMLARFTLMLENIPFFLQPGCRVLNKSNIKFDNNTEIFAAASSSSSIRGRSVSLLYIDEMGFLPNAEVFYTSTYPVISSGKKSRVIITSTANGMGNLFHKLWQGAVNGTNEYKPFRIDWWDVPGRDEEWKKTTIANTSQLQFDQEMGNQFIGTGSTLIDGNTLLGLMASIPLRRYQKVRIYQEPLEDHQYVITVDTAKGRGQDSSAIQVIDCSVMPMKQVAAYNDSRISPLLLPDLVHKLAKRYCDAYVIVESNDVGAMVVRDLYYEYEYENVYMESLSSVDALGLTMNKKIKRIGCSNLKDLIEERKLEIVDAETIQELCTFEAKGESYEATEGNHDDLVMSLVSFAWFASTDLFADFSKNTLKGMMSEERMKIIMDELPAVGYLGRHEEVNQAPVRERIGTDIWDTVGTGGMF